MLQVGKPTADRLQVAIAADLPLVVGGLQVGQAVASETEVAGTDAAVGGEDPKADKVSAVAGLKQLAFDRMDVQSQAGEVGFQGRTSGG